MRNPPLCVSLPAGRARRNVTGEGKSVRSCDGARLGASQNNHHYWRSGDVRWRYPSSLMPAVRGTWQVTGAYQGEPSPGTDGGGGRGTRPAQPRRRRPRRNRPPPPGRSQARACPCACHSTVIVTILYSGETDGSSLREAVRARAGRGRKRTRAGSAVTLRAKPVLGANAAAEAVLLPCPRTRSQATEAYEGESSPGADAVGRSADLSAGVPGARLPSLQ